MFSKKLGEFNDFDEVREHFDKSGEKYEIPFSSYAAAKAIEIFENAYNKVKSAFGKGDFSYTDEIRFIKDSYLYEKLKYDSFKSYQESDGDFREASGEEELPKFKFSKDGLDISVYGVFNSSLFELPSSYRTNVTSKVVSSREKGLTVVDENVVDILPMSHLFISRKKDNFFDLDDVRIKSRYPHFSKGISNPLMYEGFHTGFENAYAEHLKDMEEFINGAKLKSMEEILYDENGFAIPNKIDSTFLEKWYPSEHKKKHQRLKDFSEVVNTIYDSVLEKKVDKISVFSVIHEAPIVKEYLEAEDFN